MIKTVLRNHALLRAAQELADGIIGVFHTAITRFRIACHLDFACRISERAMVADGHDVHEERFATAGIFVHRATTCGKRLHHKYPRYWRRSLHRARNPCGLSPDSRCRQNIHPYCRNNSSPHRGTAPYNLAFFRMLPTVCKPVLPGRLMMAFAGTWRLAERQTSSPRTVRLPTAKDCPSPSYGSSAYRDWA